MFKMFWDCLPSPSLPLCSLSSPSLWAHVCFCSRLRPAWLTMMILTKHRERSRLASKLPQSNQLCLSALTVWALCLCRHLAISPSPRLFSLPLRLCVYPGGRCVSGRIGSRKGGSALLWSLGSDRRLSEGWDLKAPSVTALVTFQHRAAWPSRVLVCVCVYVYTVYVCGQESVSLWLQLSSRTAGCWGRFASAPEGLPFITWKNSITHSSSNPSLNNSSIGMQCYSWCPSYKYTLSN